LSGAQSKGSGSHEWKLLLAIVLAMLLGYYGLPIAIDNLASGKNVPFGVGALVPFVIILVFAAEQLNAIRKERVKAIKSGA
jgi:Sec-independent protein translocase protein TatA